MEYRKWEAHNHTKIPQRPNEEFEKQEIKLLIIINDLEFLLFSFVKKFINSHNGFATSMVRMHRHCMLIAGSEFAVSKCLIDCECPKYYIPFTF